MQPLTNEEKLAAASAPVKFNNGVELLISPLTDKDILELNIWCRKFYLKTMRETIDPSLSEFERDRIERIAQETASSLVWYTGKGVEIMVSVEGMSQLTLQAAKKHHPKITYEEIHAILLSPENLAAANEIFEELNLDARPPLKKVKRQPGKVKRKRKQSIGR